MNKKHDKELFKKRMFVWTLALICMVLMSFSLAHDNLSSMESKKCKEVIRRFNRYEFKDGAEVYYYDKDGKTLYMETYRDVNSSRNTDIKVNGQWPEGAELCIIANIHTKGKSDELKIEIINKTETKHKNRTRVHR